MNCPLCQASLECLYRRHKAAKLGKPKWWAVVHSRHPSDCKLRYENLGEGETPEEAWKSFRENLQHEIKETKEVQQTEKLPDTDNSISRGNNLNGRN